MEQYGFFNTSSERVGSIAKPLRRGKRSTTIVKREYYPPPLTTSLARQTSHLERVKKRFNFVKRCADDGQRLVVEVEEISDENHYYLKVRRGDERLTLSLIPMNELDNHDDDVDDDNNDNEMIVNDEDVFTDGDEIVDCEEVGGNGDQVKTADRDHSPPKMAFPFFESVFEPLSVGSIM